MKLKLRIPKFYTKRYGIDEEINKFCERITEIVSDKTYSPKVDILDFIPIIVPKKLIEEGLGEEFTKYDLSYKLVALGRQIDFDAYYNADIKEKKQLIFNCVIAGLNEVKEKAKLDTKKLVSDISIVL